MNRPLKHTPTVSPATLKRVFETGAAAADLTAEYDSPEALLESPAVKAMIAATATGGIEPVVMRALALNHMFNDRRLDPYTMETGTLAEPVYDIAAVMPLNRSGIFNADTFFRRIARRATELRAGDG